MYSFNVELCRAKNRPYIAQTLTEQRLQDIMYSMYSFLQNFILMGEG